jgi:Domain of unknown function (DUF4166)
MRRIVGLPYVSPTYGITVENGKLVYRSNGHLCQIGKVRIPISDVFFLGHATITETATSENEFELDFRIGHLFFGDTYHYGGIFRLSNLASSN